MKKKLKKYFINSFLEIAFIILFGFNSCQNQEKNKTNNIVQNDTNKVIELLNFEKQYTVLNPTLAINYGNKAISLAQSLNYKTGYINGMLYLGQIYVKKSEYVLAKRYFISALKYSKENEQNSFVPICLGSLGIVSERLCNYPESIKYYSQCEEAFVKNNDSIGVIKSKINISNVYKSIGESAKAVNVLLEALRNVDYIGDEYIKCVCLNNLSTLYQEMGKNNEALKYLLEVEEISKKSSDSLNLANAYNNIGIVYQALKNNELALKYYLLAAEIKQRLRDKIGVGIAFNNIGAIRFDAKNYLEALDYFKKAYYISEETQDLKSSSKHLKNMSDALLELGKIDEALTCLNKSLEIAKTINANNEKVTALFALSNLYIKTNNYKQGYNYYKAYSEFNDSLDLLQNNKDIEGMKSGYESEKKEQKIIILEKEQKFSIITQYFLIGLAFMLIIIGLLIFLWQRNKVIKNKQNAEYRQSLIEEKLAVSRLEHQNLKQELEYKEKELVNMALFIVQKINFIETLNNELKLLQKDKLSVNNEIVSKLSLLISTNVKIDKERSEFQLHVDKVNQIFFKKLKELFPNITENEKKLSALLRINLSSKDIASIYNISPSSVDMSRYRLRKKLNLVNDENIVDFLNSI